MEISVAWAQHRQQVLAELGRDADEAEVQLALKELCYEVEYTYPQRLTVGRRVSDDERRSSATGDRP